MTPDEHEAEAERLLILALQGNAGPAAGVLAARAHAHAAVALSKRLAESNKPTVSTVTFDFTSPKPPPISPGYDERRPRGEKP